MNVINYVNGIPIVVTGNDFNPSDIWWSNHASLISGVQIVNQDPFLDNKVEVNVPLTD